MTKKDYVLIAEAIKYALENERNDISTVRSVADRIAEKLQDDNPRFDWDRFLTACGFIEN